MTDQTRPETERTPLFDQMADDREAARETPLYARIREEHSRPPGLNTVEVRAEAPDWFPKAQQFAGWGLAAAAVGALSLAFMDGMFVVNGGILLAVLLAVASVYILTGKYERHE